MVDVTLRPTSGSETGIGGDYTDVDEVVTQPTAGDGLDMNWGNDDDNVSVTFGFDDIGVSGTITDATIWSYSRNTTGTITVDMILAWNGGNSSDSYDLSSASFEWNSVTHTGLSVDIDTEWDSGNGAVRFRPGTIGKSDDLDLDTLYVVITYTESSGGHNKLIGKLGYPLTGKL